MNRAGMIFSLFATVVFAISAAAQAPAAGAAVENFSLPDINGKVQTLDGLKGQNGAVVVFLSAQCPVVRAYHQRINALAAAYNEKGINFIGVNSNSSESLDWIRSNAAEYQYKFPILVDKGNVVADALGATITPETFYIDAANVILYRGAIDNDRSGKNITEGYLEAALDDSLSGRKVTRNSANAFGCSIKRAGK